MYSTAAKENSTPSKSSQPFFSKREGSNFFSSTKDVSKPFFSPAVIQPKLTINEPGDKYEQEADAMAERVMRMPLAPIFSPTGRVEVAQRSEKEEEEQVQRKEQIAASDWGRQPVIVQRKCDGCEEEEKLQRQETEEEEPLQTKRLPSSGEIEGGLMRKADGGGYTASPQLTSQLDSSKGGGDPLPGQTLGSMNQAFGSDFSKVRIHTGAQVAEMSEGIQAKAFTHGLDIYFNQGQYNPESSEGKRLLGHELTHVVQQGGRDIIQRKLKGSIKYMNGLEIGVWMEFRVNLGKTIGVFLNNFDKALRLHNKLFKTRAKKDPHFYPNATGTWPTDTLITAKIVNLSNIYTSIKSIPTNKKIEFELEVKLKRPNTTSNFLANEIKIHKIAGKS